jgi:predicted transcriptional regulator
MSTKRSAKEQAALLKELRETHAETVDAAQAYLKEQQNLRKIIRTALKAGPMTIPEIAAASGLPANTVIWHVMAMKKYDLVAEVGQELEYYQYALSEGKK